MSQKYQMLWNCGACGTEALLGVTHRCCPNCGSPQDPKKRYFPEEGKEVAVKNHVYHGADRVCPYCSVAQSAAAKFCGGCGGDLNGAKEVGRVKDPSARTTAPAEPQRTVPAQPVTLPSQPLKQASPWVGRIVKIGGGLLLAFIAVVALEMFWTKPIALTVKAHTWSRAIDIETFTAKRDGDWCSGMPGDAYSVSRTKKQSGTKSVADGQTCHTVRNDNGDGTFSKSRECETKYKEVPTYDTWCDYTVNRWVVTNTLEAKGKSKADAPAWPSTAKVKGGSGLGAERVGPKRETYLVHYDNGAKSKDDRVTLECDYPEDQWAAKDLKSEVTGQQGVLLGTVTCGSLATGAKVAH